MDREIVKEWRKTKKCVEFNLDVCTFVKEECRPGDTFSRDGKVLNGVGLNKGYAHTEDGETLVKLLKTTIDGESSMFLSHEEIEALYFQFVKKPS